MGRPKKYNTEEERRLAKKLADNKYYKKNREKIMEYNKKWCLENKDKVTKHYIKYKNNLNEEQKIKKKEYNKKWRLENKDKIKQYYQDNKEQLKKNSKEWAKNNKDKVLEKSKRWRENNREKANKSSNTCRNKRKKNDITFKLSLNIRNSIAKVIKRGGYTKTSRTHEIIDCSYEELKLHIESQWEDWMDWDNYGKYNGEFNYGWDIDHIVPVSSAINESEIIALNHYTNLQPLCSKINRDIKKDKIDF